MDRSRGGPSLPSWPLIVMIVGLGCVALAVVEVGRSVRSNREVADRAAAGYAHFATWSYREHLAVALRATAREALGAVNHGDALHLSPRIPPASTLGRYLPFAPACSCHVPIAGPMPAVFYGFTIGADTVGVGPNFHADPADGWIADPPDGMPLPPGDRYRLPADEARWLSGLLTSQARDGFSDWGYRYTIATWQGEPRFFVSTLMPTVRGDTILYAAEYPKAGIDSLLGAVLDDPLLLPVGQFAPTRAGTASNRSVLALEVRTRDATTLLSSSPPDRWPTTPATMPDSYAGLQIQAAILPSMLDRLVIGGLPSDRTPILLGMLALAAGLTVVAAIQLRREVRFARARADFVANVSHELRTPLTQIRLLLDSIALNPDGPTARRERGLGMIDREVLRLQQLVDRVLRFRQGEVPAGDAVRTPVDLAGEVAAVAEEFRPLAAARGVQLHTTLAERATVLAEPGAVRQVLLNLLDNAVKFGPVGQLVCVTLDTTAEHARLSVTDQGPGIAPAERSTIFSPYQRGEAARALGVGGSGIGLTVVADLVARHDGSITVEDAAPGARFVVTWPLDG